MCGGQKERDSDENGLQNTTPELFKTFLYEHPILLPQRLQITSKTLSHSILNFLHPPHGDCGILTVSILKRLRGFYPGKPLWSKPPVFLHTSYSISFPISVPDVSCHCTPKSANGPVKHHKIQAGSSNPKPCPPTSPRSVIWFDYHR